MKDQNQLKPPSKKRVRTRISYTATVEVLDATNQPVARERIVENMETADQAGFSAALKKVTDLQKKHQDEIDKDHQQEMKRYQEAQRVASMSIPERILSWLISG